MTAVWVYIQKNSLILWPFSSLSPCLRIDQAVSVTVPLKLRMYINVTVSQKMKKLQKWTAWTKGELYSVCTQCIR